MEDAEGPEHVAVVEEDGVHVRVRMRETVNGSGSWLVTEVGITYSDTSAAITSSALARLPYRRLLARAVADARGAQSGASILRFPSDPPAAFCERRQGRAPRTGFDWASLADAWVSAQRFYDERPGGELRLDVDRTYEQVPDVPKRWHARYPAISLSTWRTHIASIKRAGLVIDTGQGWDLTNKARKALGMHEEV